jgi:hypothetical protein
MTRHRRSLSLRQLVRRAVRRRAHRLGRRAWTAAGVGVLMVGACAGPRLPSADTGLPATTDTTATETTGPPPSLVYPMPTDTTAGPPAPGPVDVLAALAIDDRPAAGEPYRRDLYPTWRDPDGNGCDAREDALIAATLQPAHTTTGCKVTEGRWVSAYDGLEFTDPGKLDIDHRVPLAEVHRSGGAGWETARRTQIANDPANLLAVSASSNRSKGDSDPASWRPPARASWCAYATTWVSVKVAYGLTADSRERDALGQMLEECR